MSSLQNSSNGPIRSVVVSAPGKLMLAGSYAVVHGRPAVVTAVNQRLYVAVETVSEPILEVITPELETQSFRVSLAELDEVVIPKAARFVVATVKLFLAEFSEVSHTTGLKIKTHADFSASFGFGSSSAVTVAGMLALANGAGVTLSQQRLFELAYQAVIEVQGVGSGFDVAAATWGGTLRFVSPQWVPMGESGVQPLGGAAAELNRYLVVAYTGRKADTPTLVKQVNARVAAEPEKHHGVFDAIGAAADRLAASLIAGDWPAAGSAMTANHHQVAKLGVSTPQLDAMVAAAIEAGAFGASLSGAGGGDCMVALVDPNRRATVEQALSFHGEVMTVEVGAASPMSLAAPL